MTHVNGCVCFTTFLFDWSLCILNNIFAFVQQYFYIFIFWNLFLSDDVDLLIKFIFELFVLVLIKLKMRGLLGFMHASDKVKLWPQGRYLLCQFLDCSSLFLTLFLYQLFDLGDNLVVKLNGWLNLWMISFTYYDGVIIDSVVTECVVCWIP